MSSCESRKPIKVGIELEVQHKGLNIKPIDQHQEQLKVWGLSNLWRAVDDGSIGDGGVEFILNEATPFDEQLEFSVFNLLNKLKGDGYISPKTAGTHIHVDCRDMDNRGLTNLLILSIIAQPLLYAICPQHRLTSNFIVPLVVDQHLVHMIRKVLSSRIQARDNYDVIIPQAYKYSGINIWSLSKDGRGSLEFRVFPSTLDPNEILGWTNIILRLQKLSVYYKGFGGLYIALMSKQESGELGDWLFGPNLPFINEYVSKKELTQCLNKGFIEGLVLATQLTNHSTEQKVTA